MERSEFLSALDEVVELEPGTLKGEETLEDLEGWNSLAVISFMALVDEHFGISLQARQISVCKTIADLMGLVGDGITPGVHS